MQQLNFEQLVALKLAQPINLTFDSRNPTTINTVERNGPKSSSWMASPIAWDIHIPGNNYKERLEDYSLNNNIKKIVEFSPQYISPTDNNEIFIGKPDADTFFKMASIYALRTYTIIPDAATYQLFSDGDYYTVFVGPVDFLTFIVGHSVETAIQNFEKHANSHEGIEHKHILNVLDLCRKFNAAK